MRTTLFAVALLFGIASVADGQRLSFGVVGGTGLTSNFLGRDITSSADGFGNPGYHFQYLTGPRSFIFGALVEARLSEGISLEMNVLHRPMKSTIIDTVFLSNGANTNTDRFTAVRAWEFPVLLKYTLPVSRYTGRLRPFLAAGPSFRTQEDAAGTEPSRFGMSVGAGAAFHLGRFSIAPALRYTRWAREDIYPRYATKPDQLEFLTSFAYQTDSGSRRLAGRGVEIGAIAGMPLTRGFGHTYYSGKSIVERTRYLAGLTAQLDVLRAVAVEVNAIYKPMRAGSNAPNVQTPFSVVTWQFPVLAKYRWTAGNTWRPFAEAGPSFRLAGNLNGYNPSHYGVTFGGGIERRSHGLRLSPALRYTRWAKDAYRYQLPAGVHVDYSRTNANAVELIFGVSF
jgi:hypothetical protein